jgi:hypothetical protein
MNCDRLRRVVLAAERPEPPPLEVRPHLSGCSSCRDWLRRLGTIERQMSLLPVPPSEGKERLLRQLRDVAPGRAPFHGQSVPLPAGSKERALRKLAVAFALAATVAAFAVGLSFWPSREARVAALQPSAVSAWETQRVQRLAAVRTPSEHVRALSDFALKLQDEAAELARKSDAVRLDVLAGYYGRLIAEDLVGVAEQVPSDERNAVLQHVRTVLCRAESEMERLAVDLEASAAPLRRMASTARAGDRRLRELLRGEGV